MKSARLDDTYIEPEVWQSIALYGGGGGNIGAVSKQLQRAVVSIQRPALIITDAIRALVTGKRIRRSLYFTGVDIPRRPGYDPRDDLFLLSKGKGVSFGSRTDRSIRGYRRLKMKGYY